ncbi:MAG: tRNA lysidine(34) synthetase TilS [Halothiobacillaceae bacterium]
MHPHAPEVNSWLANLLAAIPAHLRKRRLWVAFSGGLDSTVLLHSLVALQQVGQLGDVQGVHVHHGLQDDADAWAEHALQVGGRLGVPMRVVRVNVNFTAGQGVEAAARTARYAALAADMQAGDVLLTAHHQDDQAETFVLQLMRGAGVRGLAAMPMLQPLSVQNCEAWHLRPLLGVSRSQLEQLAVKMGLDWVVDPSNADTHLARNFVRHELMPSMQRHWPQATQTLARCAGRMASTEGLLLDLARLDLEALRGENADCLCVEGLLRLSSPRMHNAVRAWLLELGMPAPPEARLHELSRVLTARVDAMPMLAWPGGVLRRWRGHLYALPAAEGVADKAALAWHGCDWSLQQPLAIPELGVCLHASYEVGRGLSAERVPQGVYVCVRNELSLPPTASRAALGKRLQDLGVAPWLRARLPLIFLGNNLLQISELWQSLAFCAQEHELGVVIKVEPLS